MSTDEDPDAQNLIKEALVRARADSAGRSPAPPRRSKNRRALNPGRSVEGPMSVSGLLQEWVTDRGVDVDVAAARIVSCWSEVVGTDIAGHSRVDRLDGGVLHVVAESTAWATNLRLLSASMLARVHEEIARISDQRTAVELVTEIRITGPRGPSWKKGKLAVPGRGPRDTYG